MNQKNTNIEESQNYWQPKNPTPAPWSNWPPRPWATFKYFISIPITRPWDVTLMLVPIITWLFLTPDLETMRNYEVGWIAMIYLRNLILLTLIAGGLHLQLYIRKTQETQYKYNQNWPKKKNRVFLFNNQTWHDMFWSLISSCSIWTAFEVVTYWLFANKYIPYLNWEEHPVYFVLLYLAIMHIRGIHFYLVHRLIHWKPLYKAVHYLHHKDSNPGPWSGLSFHPIEGIVYFSGVILHWILLSHPIHAIWHLQHAALAGPLGHTGFENIVVKDNVKIPGSGDYFHYLHHRYFECNFGHPIVPLDKWFGTFHDGSREAHKAHRMKRRRMHGV